MKLLLKRHDFAPHGDKLVMTKLEALIAVKFEVIETQRKVVLKRAVCKLGFRTRSRSFWFSM